MSDREVVLSTRAYAKMLLHAARYPHAAVSGLLLAEESSNGTRTPLKVVDAVPLFHQCLYVSPMYEIALTQVEARASDAGQVIAGMYGACENRAHNTPDKLADARVADKIAEHTPGAVLALIDNRALTHTLPHTPLTFYYHTDTEWKPLRRDALVFMKKDAGDVVSSLLQQAVQRELVDFDNHLDNLTLDYTNASIDKLLHSLGH